eukprot:3709243-Prymnesium_polylepis.2
MGRSLRLGALRFMLGLAQGPVEFENAAEREESIRAARAYLVGFVRPLIQLLLRAASESRRSPELRLTE